MTIALVVLLVFALALVTLYLNRRLAAREALVGWLDRRGIEADVEVERLELNGFVGKITIGDPDDPQVRVDRVEVDYALGMPWSRAGLSVTPSRIRLVRPLARASWKDGKLSLGSLDPLIEEFTARPPSPDSRAPLVIIEKGEARLQTDYGSVRILADARIDNSRLVSLDAHLPQASLRSGETRADNLTAHLKVTARDDTAHVDLEASAGSFATDSLVGSNGTVSLSGLLPYPNARTRQSHGPVDLVARFRADELADGATQARTVAADMSLKGDLKGWIDTFTLAGQTTGSAGADQVRMSGTAIRDLSLKQGDMTLAVSREAGHALRWQINGPAQASMGKLTSGDTRLDGVRLVSQNLSAGGHGHAAEAEGTVQLFANRLRTGDLDLRDTTGRLRLDLVRDSITRMKLAGSMAASQGRFDGLGPNQADDLSEVAALKQSLAAFRVHAPAIGFDTSNAGLELNLLRPVDLIPDNGGRVSLEAGRMPLLTLRARQSARGAFKLVSEPGGGLPDAEVEITQWHQAASGLEARLLGRAALDMGPARAIRLSVSGLVGMAGGVTRFIADGCQPISLDRLELGENNLNQLSGQLCPTNEPLLTMKDGRTRVHARLAEVRANVPSFGVELDNGNGLLDLNSQKSGLGLTTRIDQLRLTDTSELPRFSPMDAHGQVNLAANTWSGSLDLKQSKTLLGQVLLEHDGPTGLGRLDIRTEDIQFSDYGLQPSDLSPLAGQFIKSPAVGSAQFEGQVTWAPGTSSSSGLLTVPEIDFSSPAGRVEGLRGQVQFVSLAPLATAPDQRLRVNRLDTIVPLTDLDVHFALQDDWLKLAGGTISAAGGQISIEPFDIPLEPGTAWNGIINVHQIQLNELLKTANLQDRAELDSVVSGRLPFSFTPGEGWKISGGQLAAVRPGRLSIAPEVFDELGTSGGEEAAPLPPNTMQDLVYQALEDLAISDLTAEVNSLDNGRLGITFHISGRHDPPQREQLRLTLIEFIRRDFLKRKLNLPSDTPIELTLDTTWNANQIASDLMEYVRRKDTP